MTYTKDDLVGDIVTSNYHTAEVFNQFDIQYCCKGNISLEKVCSMKNINIDDLLISLDIHSAAEGCDILNTLSPPDLCDYIIEFHHVYVKSSIPEIVKNLNHIIRKHGGLYPELIKVNELFLNLKADQEIIMVAEEAVIFPYIKVLHETLSSQASETDYNKLCGIGKYLSTAEILHSKITGNIREIRNELNNYT